MGLRGQMPKTNKQDALHGNPGKRKPKAEIMLPDSDEPPSAPHALTADAKKHWNVLTQQLWRVGLLKPADEIMFGMLCQSLDDYHRFMRECREQEVDEEGAINPYRKLADKEFAKAMELMKNFGLSPAARARIVAQITSAADTKDNPANEFL